MPLQPGKNGIHTSLTAEFGAFLESALDEAYKAYRLEDQGDGLTQGQRVLKNLTEDYGWAPETDTFGRKAIKALPGDGGEIRVTVVLRKGQLRLDIREWFEPEG